MQLDLNQPPLRLILALIALASSMLTACAKSNLSSTTHVPVEIHRVNHTAEPFGFILADPLDKQTARAGAWSTHLALAVQVAASIYPSNGGPASKWKYEKPSGCP